MAYRPTRFAPYTSVVAQLRAAGDEKGAAAAAYKEWARGNEPAVVALAKFHRMGVRGLDLGLRGVIEKLHLDAVEEDPAPPAPPPPPQAARVAAELRAEATPRLHLLSDAPEERPQKRPRLRPAQKSPDSVIPARKHDDSAEFVAARQAVWDGAQVSARPHSVLVDVVQQQVLRGDAFVGGCVDGAFVGGSVEYLEPGRRPAGALEAAGVMEDLFDGLRDAARSIEERRRLPWVRYIGSGQYSLVCVVTDASRVPPMARGDVVMRFPKAGSTEVSVAEAATELANWLEAARGNYGPAVLAAFAPVFHPASAMLLVCLERASVTLYDAINHADNDHSPGHLRPQLSHVAELLRDTVFAYSCRQILFLDCSPGNFLLRGRMDSCTDVLATDLDPQPYRRTGHSAGTCLLLNLLLVGAHVRKHATDQFAAAWSELPTGKGTLLQFVRALPREGLANVLWADSFARWRQHQEPTDATLEKDLLGVVFHYFVSSALRDDQDRSSSTRTRLILNTRGLPTMHYFAEAMVLAGWPRDPCPLAGLLLNYWSAPLPQTVRGTDAVQKLVHRIEGSGS